MSGPFADLWTIGTHSVRVARPWPGRALEIQQAYRREADQVLATIRAIRSGEGDATHLHARLLAHRAAASGYLVAALVVDPAPPAAEPNERPATHWRRVWRWLEDTGWTVDDAHGLVVLLEAAVMQALRHTPTATAYKLAEEWSTPGGALDYVLAAAGERLLGDPAAVVRRRHRRDPDDPATEEPTAWERLDPQTRDATVALILTEMRRG